MNTLKAIVSMVAVTVTVAAAQTFVSEKVKSYLDKRAANKKAVAAEAK